MGKLKSEVHRSYSGFPVESETGYRSGELDPAHQNGLSESEEAQLTNDGTEVHVENNYIDTKKD
ncbi:MAG TPA: hypothetical protein PL004_10265 [Bacillota bacterium]|nr:hypothetical protein [Bacillota bacterium]